MSCPPVIFTVYVCNRIMHVGPHESIRNMLRMFNSFLPAMGGIFKYSKYPGHVPSKR